MSLSICQRVVINKGINIDELQIEVSTSSDKAEKSIDRLRKLINKLQESTERCTGLTKIRNQMNKIAEIGNKIEKINVGSEKMQKLVSTINSLNNIQTPNLTKLRNQMNKLSEIKEQINNLPDVSDNVSHFVNSIKPLETLGNVNVNSYIKLFNKLPEISESLKNTDFSDFSKNISQVASSIAPLANQMEKLGMGYSVLPQNIKSVISSNQQLAKSNERVTTTQVTLTSILGKTKIKVLIYYQALKRLSNVLSDCLTESNAYVENLNLFTVSMGKGAKSALNYAESINKALGIDTSEWIRNQGVFKQITSGFGVVNEKSDVMSKNLTQLGYDISSFFNINIDESMQKLQAGIAGELEPLRRLGYALDAATLQQIAYANGITTNINKMTQAQKSQLRYLAIMEQSKNAMGDMARTVITPANSLRILEQQFTQLKRAIGNVVSVVAVKLIPYVQVAVRLLTDFANWLAKKWGFELPTIDYSNIGNGLSSISDEADNATESVKETAKQMKMLAGFDELNILSSNNSDKDSITDSMGNADLGIKLPEYDFLAGADKSTDKLYEKAKEKIKELVEKLKDLKQWIIDNRDRLKELGSLLVGIWVVKKLSTFVGWIKKLWGWTKQLKAFQLAKRWVEEFLKGFKTSTATTAIGKLGDGFKNATGKIKTWRQQLSLATRLLGTIAGSALAGFGSYNLFKDLATDTASWKSVLGDSAMIVGGLGMSWIFGGLPGLGVGLLVTAFAGLLGYLNGVDEKLVEIETKNVESLLFNNGGTKISELTGAFRNQFDSLTDLSGILSDYDQQIKDNRISIDEYQGTIDTYKEKIDGTGKLSEEEITPMKEAVDGLVEALQKGVDLECSKFFDIVKTSVSNVAEDVGLDIKSMTTALTEFQNTFSTETDKLNSDVSNYLDKLKLGEPITADEKKAYEDALTTLSELSKGVTEEEVNFKEKLNGFLTVDFESKTDFTKAFNDLKSAADEAKGAAEDIYISSKTNYENLKLQVENSYEAGLIGKDMYKTTTQELENYRKGIEEAYKDKKEEISSSLQDIVQNMYDNVDEAVRTRLDANSSVSDKNAEKYYADMKESLSWVYDELDEFIEKKGLEIDKTASEQWLRNKKGYFTAKDLLDQDEWKKEAIKCGYQVVDGFDVGLTDNQIKALKSVKNNNELTMAEWKRFWDINSPSKETEKIGKYLVEGESQGIEKNSHLAITSIRSLSEKMLKTARENFDFYSIGQKCIDTLTEGISHNIGKLSSILYAVGIDGATISLNGINSSNMSTSINGYASGGFPTTGQLFVARENGIPEMVGKIGNQTAVANNGQIEQGIANAVYKAMSSAMGSPVNSEHPINVTVPVYIDGQKIDEQQYSYRQRQLVRSNGRREY